MQRKLPPATSRQDYLDVCSVPGSLFMAIQDNMCFYGYRWNNQVAMQSNRKLIKLNKGDLIIFRGDYMFGRIGYRANHAYLDTPLYDRPVYQPPVTVALMDGTRWVDDLFRFMWNCPYKGTGEHSLRKHLNRFHGMFFKSVRTPTP